MAQWLRLYTSKMAEGMGLIPGQEIQILYVTQCRKTEKIQKDTNYWKDNIFPNKYLYTRAHSSIIYTKKWKQL